MARMRLDETWVALIAVGCALVFGLVAPDSISWVGNVVALVVVAILIARQWGRRRAER